ncbi:MAG: VCBS repeat-containing protein, partial [Acidobacteria bacterium]|nr:VCBS repeat-containing protein [Acidobacteriota bacterium]
MDEFQKIVASGQAVASDYLNFGWALLQANRLDEALGVLTTAKQMEPALLAADYALGILYKRERRYLNAEAALKQVLDRDPHDPGTWFNLGSVYLEQRKLEPALQAHRRVVEMGFARGQNFYVVSLFRCFNLLVRLEQPSEAQKYLELHGRMRDKVPGVAVQAPALEAGKYGTIVVPASPPTVPARQTALQKVAFVEVANPLRLELPSGASAETKTRSDLIPRDQYSLSFARFQLVPRFGPSLALGDYDGDGRTDLYVVNPAGSNRLLHNDGGLRFREVTDALGLAGPGASLGAVFADYNNSGHASLFVAGLGGITLYRNNSDGTFADATKQAGLQAPAGELATSA